MRLTNEQIKQIDYSWHNTCSSKLANSSDLPTLLVRELEALQTKYDGDDEALLKAVKTLVTAKTSSPATRSSMISALKADFYRIVGTDIAVQPISSPFASMGDLMNGLDDIFVELEEVKEGKKPLPDLDSLFKINHEAEPSEEDRLVEQARAKHRQANLAERIQAASRRISSRAAEVELILKSKSLSQQLRLEGMAIVLEEARLAGCYDTVSFNRSFRFRFQRLFGSK